MHMHFCWLQIKLLNRAFMACPTRCDRPFLQQFHAVPQSQSHSVSKFLSGIKSVERRCNVSIKGRSLSQIPSFQKNGDMKGNKIPGLTLAMKSGLGDLEVTSLSDKAKDATPPANGRGNPSGFLDRSDKIVVAVDVDEVLGNFLSALNCFVADRYSSNHSVSEYHVYEFFKIWNCSRDEAAIRVHEFFKTPYFKKGVHPIPGAHQALHNLSRFCNLSIVTSRQNVIKDHTIDWIEKHYPGLFHEIHFGNHFALDGQQSKSKSEICRSLGAKILIDDNPRYANECAEAGIRSLLFDYENSYPWSKMDSGEQHSLVSKVSNWDEVEQEIVSWIIS